MDPAHADMLQNRVKPMLAEVFDGYVILGYVTGKDGRRTRLVLYANSTEADGKIKDCALVDGLSAPLALARHWMGTGS